MFGCIHPNQFLDLVPLEFLEEREDFLEEYASVCGTEKCSVKR